jgi:hypothetical protein
MLGKKKGNVDTDIVFLAMKKVYKKDNFDKIVLVSGDGDYLRLVDFLIEEKNLKNYCHLIKNLCLLYIKNLVQNTLIFWIKKV